MNASPPPTENVFLQDGELALCQLLPSHVDGPYLQWLNSAEVCAGNSHHVYPYHRESAIEFVQQTRTARDRLVLAIHLQTRHVGNVSLQAIHPVSRSAELAILLGDATVWGKGIGYRACRLIVAHGFESMNLHRVYCGTFATNLGMQGVAKKLGMTEEGRRREAAFKDGKYVDVIEFGLLRHDFDAKT